MIHGPEIKEFKFIISILQRFPWPLEIFKIKDLFLSIENLCFVINELLTNEKIPSGIYNVADNEALSTS
jgi:hypothetical protein